MEVKQKIAEVFKTHNLMHIATVDEDGLPKVRGVDFALSDQENVLYFVTRAESNKVRQIRNNNNVHIAIDHDCPSMETLNQLRYVKATGKATIAETPEEAQKIFGTLMQKFPFFAEIPGDPNSMLAVKVTLDKIVLNDNTVSFGHEEEVSY